MTNHFIKVLMLLFFLTCVMFMSGLEHILHRALPHAMQTAKESNAFKNPNAKDMQASTDISFWENMFSLIWQSPYTKGSNTYSN